MDQKKPPRPGLSGADTLIRRITDFDIDGGDAAPAFPFAARLARDQGWTRDHADRVIVEYKRFIALAATGTTPVCPSEAVDEAWHLHLTFTRSYWQRFCRDTLGRDIHHDPSRGGRAEDTKHVDMYGATLQRYADVFGHAPPADIWPPAKQRFRHRQATPPTPTPTIAPRSTFGKVNARSPATAPQPLPPQPASERRSGLFVFAELILGGAAVTAVVASTTSHYGVASPFDLQRSTFLWVLVPALITAIVVGMVLYPRLRRGLAAVQAASTTVDDQPLNWAEAAYIAGGRSRLTTATLAAIIARGAARVDSRFEPFILRATGFNDPSLSSIEREALACLPAALSGKGAARDLKDLNRAIDTAFAGRADTLAARGLKPTGANDLWALLLALLPLLAVVTALAVPRLAHGLAGGHPVSFLVLWTLAAVIFAPVAIISREAGRPLARGDAAIAALQSAHPLRRTGASIGPAAAAAMAMAVALHGTDALAFSGLEPVRDLGAALPRQTPGEGSGGGCGAGCATSGGSGSSDSGGGGGCGGGCGGCGG